MAHTDSRDWKDLKGLGGAKIAHIQAALEIGRRYREDDVSIGKQFNLMNNEVKNGKYR